MLFLDLSQVSKHGEWDAGRQTKVSTLFGVNRNQKSNFFFRHPEILENKIQHLFNLVVALTMSCTRKKAFV